MIVGDGRPLRFLGLVGGGWVAVRVALLWHMTGSLPHAVREIASSPTGILAAAAVPAVPVARAAMRSAPGRLAVTAPAVATLRTPPSPDPLRVEMALLAMTRVAGMIPANAPMQVGTGLSAQTATPPPPRPGSASRFSFSSWMIARGGTGTGATGLSPQLGGTQGGVRIDYALTRTLAATGRVAAPAAGAGRELSLGIAWRPAGAPLRFVVERRVALDSGRGGPAFGVSGGVSAVPLPIDFRLESYGQAGVVLRDGVERYVDGSLRAARPVAQAGGVTVDLGGGVWGGAQRGVARLDVGPSIGLRVPMAGQAVRVALDWRQRVAGAARPGSGPALTMGVDF